MGLRSALMRLQARLARQKADEEEYAVEAAAWADANSVKPAS
jgi:hypothetical protein